MNVRTLTWFEDDEPRDLRRWAAAALIVVGVHIGAIGGYAYVHRPDPIGDDAAPVAVDFAPGDDTIDQAAVEPTPEPQQQQPPPEVEKPPPPPPPEPPQDAVPLPETPPPPPKVVEQEPPPQAPTPPRTKGGSVQVPASYVLTIFKHLARYKPPYPRDAVEHREEGTVEVGFRLDRSGHLLHREIIRSSGVPELDTAALAMIEKAQPFPPFPASMAVPNEDFDFPLHFTNR